MSSKIQIGDVARFKVNVLEIGPNGHAKVSVPSYSAPFDIIPRSKLELGDEVDIASTVIHVDDEAGTVTLKAGRLTLSISRISAWASRR